MTQTTKNQPNDTPNYALIVAGGSGTRMQSAIPKQFLLLHGKPILMHTIEAFRQFDSRIHLLLVLPAGQIDFWKNICQQYAFTVPHTIIAGGETRFQSVKNGLAYVPDEALVAIHDGVRPFVSTETIARTFETAAQKNTAIPIIDLVDSIRQITANGSRAVKRQEYKLVQTPQTFRAKVIKQAYQQPYQTTFTDDASVAEAAGANIFLVEGNRENIKITTPDDLKNR